MSRVAGYALRQQGTTASGTLTVTQGAGYVETLAPTMPVGVLTDPGTMQTDPAGVLPDLPDPYWYVSGDYLRLAVVRSRAVATNFPRMRHWEETGWTDWYDVYNVADDLQVYDSGTWSRLQGTLYNPPYGNLVYFRVLTNTRTLGMNSSGTSWWNLYLPFNRGGYAMCLNHYDHYLYCGSSEPGEPSTVESPVVPGGGYDFTTATPPVWPAAGTDYIRMRHWETYTGPFGTVEYEGSVPATVTVDVEWFWEWWVVAKVHGPDGCDDWTDDGGVTPTPSESVALVSDWTGFAWRAYVAAGAVHAQRRTRPTGTFTTRALISGGTQPALSVRPDGRARCLYVDGPDVLARNLDTDEDEYVATGSYPREIWLRHGGLRVLTYCASGTVYAAVTDAQDNTLYGGPVTVATGVDAQAFDVVERPDGRLEGWLSVGGTLTQYRSIDNGRTWST